MKKPTKPQTITIRLGPKLRKKAETQAKEKEMSVSEWIRYLIISAAVALGLALAATASALNNGSIALRVCSVTKTVQSPSRIGPKTVVIPRVFVNGHQLTGKFVGERSARWSGYGVVAQLWQSPRFAPLTFRVASVRAGCANVRLNFILH